MNPGIVGEVSQAAGPLLSNLSSLTAPELRGLQLAFSMLAPNYSQGMNSAIGGYIPTAQAQGQLGSLENTYNANQGMFGGSLPHRLLTQLGGSLFGGVFNPEAHAYLQQRASTANALANATGQDPNAVLSSLPSFAANSPASAQAAFQNIQAPLTGYQGGGTSLLSGLYGGQSTTGSALP